MPSNLELTIDAAIRAGMTYGAYVGQYGIVNKDQQQKVKTVRCSDCNTDISHIKHGAKYCTFCAAKRLGGGNE